MALPTTLPMALGNALADATIMYHRTHGFHWNVTGADFPQWHDKFEEIYSDVLDSLDPMAECIRKANGYAPFRLEDLSARASVADGQPSSYDPQTLVKDLIETNDGVLTSLNIAFQVASASNQQGTANFLADRIDQHSKWKWQLSASVS
jgi:starvation-inducible DNA-binding protein